MPSTPSPRDDGRVTDVVGFLPLRPGAQSAPSLREDGRTTDTVRFSPPKSGVQSTPSPREDCRVAATVGVYRRDRVCKALQSP